MLRFIDDRPVDRGLLRESIAFSDFDNMRKMELENRFDRPMLRPGDPFDPESYKVRRGVVGGYRDYLSPKDIGYIEEVAQQLQLPAALAIAA